MKTSESGFSLIEVMISLFISTIGTLALMVSILTALKAQRNVASLTDFDTLQNQMKMFISNQNLCPKLFIGDGPQGALKINGSASQAQAPALKGINLGGQMLQAGTRLISGSTIGNMNFQIISPTGIQGGYSTILKVSGFKNPMAEGAQTLEDISLPVTMNTDKDGVVVGCQLGADTSSLDYAAMCTQLFQGTMVSLASADGKTVSQYCSLPNVPSDVTASCTFPAGAAGWQTCNCPNQNPNAGPNLNGVGTQKNVNIFMDGTSKTPTTVYCRK